MIKTTSLREIFNLPEEAYTIIVMRHFPWWFKGLKGNYDEYLPDLAPSRELLRLYKEELGRLKDPGKAWKITKFEMRYIHYIMHSSGRLAELRRIKALGENMDVYLICHERLDAYCHRRVLKELIDKYSSKS